MLYSKITVLSTGNERKMKMIKTLSTALFGLTLSAFLAACGDSNSASTEQHEHFEVEGWNLYWSDWTPAYSVYRGKADTTLEVIKVNANCMSEHIHVKFLDENQEEVAGPEDDEHSLGWEIGDESLLDVHSCGGWGLHLKGIKEGETTLILKVNHNDHADARTPEIKIVVDTALAAEDCPFQESEDHDHEGEDHDHEAE